MSRIGKRTIKLKAGVQVTQDADLIKVKGPKGEIVIQVTEDFKIKLDGTNLNIELVSSDPRGKLNALHGLYGSLLNNAAVGVSDGFTKKLTLIGVGYKAQVQGKKLIMALGYSHPVEFEVPEGIAVNCPDQTTIEIAGSKKDEVGQFAAVVRSSRPPEPYKGKGVLYDGEKIRRKVGKAGKK